MSQESDFDSFFFPNSYNILQSYALSWFLLSVKFPARNPFMNSRLIGILHCLFGIYTWMTNRHFNLYKSKIAYLVFPTPPKHTVPTASLSQSITIAQIQLLDQKKKERKKIRESCLTWLIPLYQRILWSLLSKYIQNLTNSSQFPHSSISVVGATNISSLDVCNSLLTDFPTSSLDTWEFTPLYNLSLIHLKCNFDHITTLSKTAQWFSLHKSKTCKTL